MNFTYLSPVRLTGCILALTLGSSLQAKDIHQPGEPQSESRARVEIVRHSVRQDTPIRESAFVYDLARDNFDLTSYLERQAPHLLTHEEAISHWSGFASIHPRIALALMETRTQVVSNPTNATLEEPFGALSNESGFSNQLGDVLTRLSQRFTTLRERVAPLVHLLYSRVMIWRNRRPRWYWPAPWPKGIDRFAPKIPWPRSRPVTPNCFPRPSRP